MRISILVQDLNLELLNFIIQSIKKNIFVKNIIFVRKTEMHRVRKKQIKIRQKTYINNKKKPKFLIIKKIIIHIFFNILKYKYRYKIFYINKNFITEKNYVYNYPTLLYSYEGIINEKNLKKFKKGLINIHPAILPEYRGLDAGLWALYENGKLGVSAYLLDKGIDTGPIIKRYFIKKKKFKSIQVYKKKLREIKMNSFIDALKKYKKKQFEIYNPKISKSQNKGIMSKKN